MQTYTDNVVDRAGNTLSGAQVTVYLADGTTKATLPANPIVTGADGEFSFTLPDGKYVVSASHPLIATKTEPVYLFDSTTSLIPTSEEKASFVNIPTADEKAGLAGISAADPAVQSSEAVHNVATIAALRLLPVVAGKAVQPLGYYAAGDGGGGPVRVGKTGAPGTYVDNGGSIIVPTGGDGSAAWVWEWSGAVNVKWFGAKGDGVTSDTSSIQAAINFVSSGGAVFVPKAKFLCGNLRITQATNDGYGRLTTRLRIFGEGHSAHLIAESVNPILHIGNIEGTTLFDISIEDLRFDGADISTSNIRISAAHRINLINCRIDYADGPGVLFDTAAFGAHVVEKCLVRNNAGHGIYVPNAANGGGSQANGNALKIKDNTILMNGGTGVRLEAGSAICISGNDISSNGNGGVYAESVFGLTINGRNYFEDHKTGTYKCSVWLGAAVFGVSIDDNYMFLRDDGGELYGVYSEANASVVGRGNFIQSYSGAGGTGFYFADGSFSSVNLVGNSFSGIATLARKPSTGGITRYHASHAGDGGGVCGPVFGGIDVVEANPGVLIKNTLSGATEDEWTIRSTNDVNNRAYLSFLADSGVEHLRVERSTQMAFNDAAIHVACNRSGTISLSQVSIGAADSGGAGFRILRVAN